MAKHTDDEDDGKDFRRIDKGRLDYECVRQSDLMGEYAEKLALANLKHDDAKAELDVIAAELKLQIRAAPKGYGIEGKVTEDSIECTLLTQERHQRAVKNVNRLKYEAALLKAAVEALQHKKSMLEELVTLDGRNYFAAPVVRDAEAREAMDERVKRDVRTRGDRRRG